MDDPWKQLPRAAAIVYVGVLAAGSGRVARAEQAPATAPSEATELSEDMIPIAPTCGPQCHGGSQDPMPIIEPPEPDPDYEREEIAPTCGPECHDSGGYDGDVGPPPIAPEERKKGCAVESVEDQRGLALLGLGLLAGVAARRPRGDESQ
jgi:MYXO-CTERM domain-containing protein